jgi:nucleotide-binding universal stress UspA family protein
MQTIAFTTGLDPAEAPAIATAAALAAASGARLVTVHATAGAPPARALPHPEELASRWGCAIAHDEMIHTCCEDVTDTLLDALRRVKPELVVAGTHQRTGLSQLFGGSVAESVARNIVVPTLVVPLHGKGLADAGTGALDLRRILVPAGDAEATKKGLEAAAWLARAAGATDPEVVLLHVDDGTPMPTLDAIPDGLRIVKRTVKGSLEEAIARVSEELSSCAIVMATRGHDGLVDTFAGSHTERVVRKVHCPVLTVPLT